MATNKIEICGDWLTIDKIEHVGGYPFNGYAIKTKIQRTNPKTRDSIIVLSKEKGLLERFTSAPHQKIKVSGSVQSIKNWKTGRLLIFVYANKIEFVDYDTTPENVVEIAGVIAKETIFRVTPKQKRITELVIQVNSQIVKGFCYIPLICWGSEADLAAYYNKGDFVNCKGRLQSRTYTKKVGEELKTRTAYEISANVVVKED